MKIRLAAILWACVLPWLTMLAHGGSLDRVVDSNTLRIAMTGTQAPLNMRDREGNLIGLEVELVTALATAMGVEPDIVTLPFEELLPALQGGQVDMVVSGLAITAQRARSVSFIGPYMLSGKSILTTSLAVADAKQAEEINRRGVKLAALPSSTSEQLIVNKLPEVELVTIKDYEQGIAMVLDGKVDGMMADMPICVLATLQNPGRGLLTLDQPISIEPVGIAVPPGEEQFRLLIGNYLETFEKTGLLNALRQKWLEDDSWLATLPE